MRKSKLPIPIASIRRDSTRSLLPRGLLGTTSSGSSLLPRRGLLGTSASGSSLLSRGLGSSSSSGSLLSSGFGTSSSGIVGGGFRPTTTIGISSHWPSSLGSSRHIRRCLRSSSLGTSRHIRRCLRPHGLGSDGRSILGNLGWCLPYARHPGYGWCRTGFARGIVDNAGGWQGIEIVLG